MQKFQKILRLKLARNRVYTLIKKGVPKSGRLFCRNLVTMENIKIAIGTNSAYKLNFIKKVMYDLDFSFETVNANVDSGVSSQPCKVGETKLGSINRAKNVLQKFQDSDIGIGVEFGYEPDSGSYKMVCWASIYTKDGEIFSEQSSTLELPKQQKDILESGIEVGDKINEYVDSLGFSEVRNRFSDIILKKRLIEECVMNVMIRYLLKELY